MIRSRPAGHPGFQLEPCGNSSGEAPPCAPGGVFSDRLERPVDLWQFHVHTPSEHTVGGAPFALEMHLVHVGSPGARSVLDAVEVVAVLFPMSADGSHNPDFDAFWLEIAHERRVGRVALERILNGTRRAGYGYDGSLSSPPCQAGLRWHVLVSDVGVNGPQLLVLQYALGGLENRRPPQPLGARSVDVVAVRP
jgi:carbonic anhydrase